jgi:hypothetical protein
MKVSGTGDSKQGEGKDLKHFTSPVAAAALLCAEYGEAEACKIALREQRRAKRARSKRRFIFWGEVETQIGNGD